MAFIIIGGKSKNFISNLAITHKIINTKFKFFITLKAGFSLLPITKIKLKLIISK
jgi:hypothetical protein